MTETKKAMTPEQAAAKHLRTMSDKQLLNRVKKYPRTKLRKHEINIDIVRALVLALVMENTKPLGRMEPYLR
jgi:hypothetical protein